jgi:hypothetical protein
LPTFPINPCRVLSPSVGADIVFGDLSFAKSRRLLRGDALRPRRA